MKHNCYSYSYVGITPYAALLCHWCLQESITICWVSLSYCQITCLSFYVDWVHFSDDKLVISCCCFTHFLCMELPKVCVWFYTSCVNYSLHRHFLFCLLILHLLLQPCFVCNNHYQPTIFFLSATSRNRACSFSFPTWVFLLLVFAGLCVSCECNLKFSFRDHLRLRERNNNIT